MADLPQASAPGLILTHPTPAEKIQTWTLNSKNWGSALSLDGYIERETYLTTIPATRDGGVTHWILTDSNAPTDTRPVLAACESLHRRALVCLPGGEPKEVITHGIGSVFCPPSYRGRGYASRMLTLLGSALKTWQKEQGECYFSILYSDIGKKYYAGLGWEVFPSSHIAFPALAAPAAINGNGNGTAINGHHKKEGDVKEISAEEIAQLCALDVQYIRTAVKNSAEKTKKPSVAIIPDHITMGWHQLREDFMCGKLHPGKVPTVKGALSSGEKGTRIWIAFTRTFYGPLEDPKAGNSAFILRLVIEDEQDTEENAQKLKAVLQVAQREANKFGLGVVKMWNVTPLTQKLLDRTGLQHTAEEREEESICSLMWYGEGKGGVEGVEWVANEKYGWC